MSWYNRWQNQDIYNAAYQLSDEQRAANHNIFWGSIIRTLSHIYWGDRIWLSRFNLVDAPNVSIEQSGNYVTDWSLLQSKRSALDIMLIQWCDDYPKGPVVGNLEFFSGVMQKQIAMPLSTVFIHFFNHQTHHRGQTNALLSYHGIKTGDTDLFLMPKTLWP